MAMDRSGGGGRNGSKQRQEQLVGMEHAGWGGAVQEGLSGTIYIVNCANRVVGLIRSIMPKRKRLTRVDAALYRWPSLPSNVLDDISCRLNDAIDCIRFHAVCKHWRFSLPPVLSYPAFLPWLLSPRVGNANHRRARCLFSSKSTRSGHTTTYAVRDKDRKWVIGAEDGTAYWLVTVSPESCVLVDPFTGSAVTNPMPCNPDELKPWVKHAVATVYGDGTIFLYAFCSIDSSCCAKTLDIALLHSSSTAWTTVQRDIYFHPGNKDNFSVIYRDGKVTVCAETRWCILSIQAGEADLGRSRWMWLEDDDGEKFQSSYLVEFRGEILWVFVQLKSASNEYEDVDTLASALSGSIYALREAAGGEPLQWVKRECRSLADRVLFLGPVRSFAVDAARLSMSFGCVYFIDRRQLYVYDGIRRKPTPERSRVFKYSFHDDKSEFVEELPSQWNRKAFMWVSPRPAIAAKVVLAMLT
ncbi:hypothetical protein EJB05_28926, partial [Eragrostis curvula]